MRLFPREGPEPLQGVLVEEQFRARIELIGPSGTGVLSASWTSLLVRGQGSPSGRESDRIVQAPKPIAEPGLSAQGVTFVPADGQVRLGRQHQDRRGETDGEATDQKTASLATQRKPIW